MPLVYTESAGKKSADFAPRAANQKYQRVCDMRRKSVEDRVIVAPRGAVP
jgi:hypothetical protein